MDSIKEEDQQRDQHLKEINASLSASPKSKVVVPIRPHNTDEDEAWIKYQMSKEKKNAEFMSRISKEASPKKSAQEKKNQSNYKTVDFALKGEDLEELEQTDTTPEPEQKVEVVSASTSSKNLSDVTKQEEKFVLPTITEIKENPLQSSSTMKAIMQSLAQQPDSPLGKSIDSAILNLAKQQHKLSKLDDIQKRTIGVFDSYFEMFLDDESLNEHHIDRRRNRSRRETISYYLNQMKSIPCDFVTDKEYLHKKACMIKIIRGFFLTFKPFHVEVTQEAKQHPIIHVKNTSLRLTEDLLNDLQSVYYSHPHKEATLEQLKKKKLAEQRNQAEAKIYQRKEPVLNALSECVMQYRDHPLSNSCDDYFKMISEAGSRGTDITKANTELDKLISEANELVKKINETKHLKKNASKPSQGRFWDVVSTVASYVSGSQSQAKPAARQIKRV